MSNRADSLEDLSSETSSTAGSSKSSAPAEWCPRMVLVRGWAPLGSPASQKILLCCLPHCLQNNVVVRAPFAANDHISFGLKDGGGWDSCRAVQEALIAGVESNMPSRFRSNFRCVGELP